MIVVTLAIIAATVTVAVSCSVYTCLEREVAEQAQPKTICRLQKNDKKILVTSPSGSRLCHFEPQSSSTVVNNIYKQCGVLRNERTSHVIAHFYKNTVGKGGFIEVWPSKAIEPPSFVLSILSRFQTNEEPVESTKIFLSSKLSGGMYDITIEESRFQWSIDEEVLRIEGSSTDAMTLDYTNPDEIILQIYKNVIMVHLSICIGVFFASQQKR